MKSAVLAWAVVLAGCSSPSTPAPAQTKVLPAGFRVVGYYVSWYSSVQTIDFTKLTHVIWAFETPNSDGTIQAEAYSANLTAVLTAARAAGCKVLLSLGGGYPFPASTFDSIAAGTGTAAALAANVLAVVNQYGFDGVDIDWEIPGSAADFDALMGPLATTLHAHGKLLSAALASAEDVLNGSTTLGSLDFANIMAYDGGYPTTGGSSGPSSGPQSPISLTESAFTYWSARLPASRLNLGVPFYGRSDSCWGGTNPSNEPETYADLIAPDPAVYSQEDDTAGSFSPSNLTAYNYNGMPTMAAKAKYALAHSGGVMIWDLHQDSPGAYSLLGAIFNAVAVAH